MNRELCELVGRVKSSPLSYAIKSGVYTRFPDSFFEGMEQRWIAALRVDRLDRRDRIFAEQCRQSYNVADSLGIGGVLVGEVTQVVERMMELGLLGNEDEEIPAGLLQKYQDYTLTPPSTWRTLAKKGDRFLIQVGTGLSGPVVVVTDIKDAPGLSLHDNTPIYEIAELMKFSQDAITS